MKIYYRNGNEYMEKNRTSTTGWNLRGEKQGRRVS